MSIFTLSDAARAIATDLRRVTTLVVEHLQDPTLFGDPGLESSMQVLLDRLCLSIQVGKPVGLATWAMRESRRLGPRRAFEVAQAAAHVLASEAARFPIDHRRLLSLLETLTNEVHSGLTAHTEERPALSCVDSDTQALLALLEERDPELCSHAKATGEWVRRLCISLGITGEHGEFIALCGMLHDVGKIRTPPEILSKPAELSADEWAVAREHCAEGEAMLLDVPTLARCAPIVRSHHERWDGKGYPDGLIGERTPFESRVISVADAFHAMISERPYRRALNPHLALEMLNCGRATQWDPLVVDAMLALFPSARTARGSCGEASSA
jgi:HD-GYP domain-containing protein (c-di-GMP phosphodiesterase class II)